MTHWLFLPILQYLLWLRSKWLLFQLKHLEYVSLNYFCQHTFPVHSMNYFTIFHNLFCQLSHVLLKPKDQLVFYAQIVG